MNITVLGAGAWGTALAASVAGRHSTRLWARNALQAEQMHALRRNMRYLPEMVLPSALHVTADLQAALAHAQHGLVLVATPMAGLAETLQHLQGHTASVLWLCKGFAPVTGWLGHEAVAALQTPAGVRVGVLSGPSFAIEVGLGQPTALVAASHDTTVLQDAVQALHTESLRIYTSTDPVGVEVGGAVKNVLAIATGIADGMSLGLNTRAALITRGLAEMTRLGVALGARVETFMGLSGLGDLVLTATGDLSRNRTVGRMLAQGMSLQEILNDLGHVAEGVNSAPRVVQRALALGIEMPISQTVNQVLQGHTSPAQALEQLMGRSARREAI
jgi:glycerol-3-phosphate dehydrogenase (NAD(P)+)